MTRRRAGKGTDIEMKNTCKINIAGNELTIKTDYDTEYANALADRINGKVGDMLRHTPGCTKLHAALLCLLDETDRRERAEAELITLRKKAESDRLDMEILQIENEKLSGKRKSGAAGEKD